MCRGGRRIAPFRTCLALESVSLPVSKCTQKRAKREIQLLTAVRLRVESAKSPNGSQPDILVVQHRLTWSDRIGVNQCA